MATRSSSSKRMAEMAEEKRKIKAKKMVRHIRSGMSATDLMERHSLSPGQLREVLQRLVEAGWITKMEQFKLIPLSDSGVMHAFESTTKALAQIQKSGARERGDQSNQSDSVESTQVVEIDEPSLRSLRESLRQSTEVISLKKSRGEPSK